MILLKRFKCTTKRLQCMLPLKSQQNIKTVLGHFKQNKSMFFTSSQTAPRSAELWFNAVGGSAAEREQWDAATSQRLHCVLTCSSSVSNEGSSTFCEADEHGKHIFKLIYFSAFTRGAGASPFSEAEDIQISKIEYVRDYALLSFVCMHLWPCCS